MRRIVRTLLIIIIVLLSAQGALAQASTAGAADLDAIGELAEGTELVMLDARGSRIVGRGRVDGGVVRLTVGRSVGDFVLLVVGVDGEVLRFVGREWLRDSFRISLADGGQMELEDLIAGLGLKLQLERQVPDADESGVTVPNDPDDDGPVDVPGDEDDEDDDGPVVDEPDDGGPDDDDDDDDDDGNDDDDDD